MGVPKFFRWLSERYPKINQRVGSPPNPETRERYFKDEATEDGDAPFHDEPDPLSKCGLPPELDRLYLDMNGIIHGCSHNNDSNNDDNGDAAAGSSSSEPRPKISNPEIFRNVCYYLDRVIGDIAQPKELVYMAIDGVAPRAKLNQQRSRRYRSGQEGTIEMNIYEAHAKAMKELQYANDSDDDDDEDEEDRQARRQREKEFRSSSTQDAFDIETGYSMEWENTMETADTKRQQQKLNDKQHQQNSNDNHGVNLHEVAPGRFQGKFETKTQDQSDTVVGGDNTPDDDDDGNANAFHHNEITPGTEFFSEFSQHLEHFVKYKISTDPKWQHLTIIISGPNVPGEGEHKIMDFIREQKASKDYNPNLRHCIMGQDGDLIMLGLATHEPNLVLLRERVVFQRAKQKLNLAAAKDPLDLYIHNSHFEFLHMGVLRDYLAYDFTTSNVYPKSPWDLERTIDDFVFMTFFVGNDFLPHMPALDIGDDAFDLLFFTYKTMRRKLKRQKGKRYPYLTNAGTIVSGQRLEQFLSAVGSHENEYYDKKKAGELQSNEALRKQYTKLGMSSTAIPADHLVASKEQADRSAYRKMLEAYRSTNDSASASATTMTTVAYEDDDKSFMPVMTSEVDFEPEEEEELGKSFMSQMGSILQNSLSTIVGSDNSDEARALKIDDQDLKGRYYYDKFQMTPFDAEKHLALRKAYMEGLVWTLKYYYEGCASWEWYYPYHYGPMLSDLMGLDEILDEISFEGKKGEPLRPFEQLMGCMPPSQANMLPKPYRWLLTDPESPILDFYPKSFTVDMNGKRWPWEAVTLLPFIDSKRLLDAVSTIDHSQLTDGERERNSFGETIVLEYDPEQTESLARIGETEGFQGVEHNKAKVIPYEASAWKKELTMPPVLKPTLEPGVQVPLPGFGSLRDAPVHTLRRLKLGLNVFGTRSRYGTSFLEMSDIVSPMPPIETVAEELIGQTIFVNYPYFLEALVVAVSNENATIKGENEPWQWTQDETLGWQVQRMRMEKEQQNGEAMTGTGGLMLPEDRRMTLSVRPFEGLVKNDDGDTVKTYAKFTMEVPYITALWKPSNPDERLSAYPAKMETNPYEIALPLRELRSQRPATARKTLFPPRFSSNSATLDNTTLNVREEAIEQKPRKRAGKPSDRSKQSQDPSGIESQVSDGAGAVRVRKTLFPPRKVSVSARGFSSVAPSQHTASGHVATLSRIHCTPEPNHEQLRRQTPRKIATAVRSKAGPRGRLLAAGVVAAGFLFNSANGSSEFRSFFPRRKTSLFSRAIHLDSSKLSLNLINNIRGGDVIDRDGTPMEASSAVPPLEFAHGTTTLSFVFQGGIIAAVDSRASLGSFVGSKTTQKVLPVNSHILGTMAGGAADCMFWIRKLKSEALLHELTESTRMSVARASRLLSNALYQNRGLGLSVGTMIMGFDEDHSPKIYYVDNTGVRIEGDQFAVGSGSTFALGILDTERQHVLNEEDAIALAIKAIRHATFRDAYSGGIINVFLITRDGWKKVFTEDLGAMPATSPPSD